MSDILPPEPAPQSYAPAGYENPRFYESALGNPGKWSEERLRKIPEYKEQIIEMVRTGMFISEIAENVNIAARTITMWRHRDREFGEAFADAESQYMDVLEKEAIRRAYSGVTEPVVSAGKLIMDPDPEKAGKPLMVRRYSDNLMMFILRGRRRDVYGDKREIDSKHTVDVVGAKSELERKFAAVAGPSPTPGVPEQPDGRGGLSPDEHVAVLGETGPASSS